MKNEIDHAVTQSLRQLISEMVNHPAELLVEQQADGDGLRILINPAKDDYGIIVGRDKRTIKALQYIAQLAGQRTGVRAELELRFAAKSRETSNGQGFVQRPDVDEPRLISIARGLIGMLIGQSVADETTFSRSNDLLMIVVPIDRSDAWQAGTIVAINPILHCIGVKNGIDVRTVKRKAVRV